MKSSIVYIRYDGRWAACYSIDQCGLSCAVIKNRTLIRHYPSVTPDTVKPSTKVCSKAVGATTPQLLARIQSSYKGNINKTALK